MKTAPRLTAALAALCAVLAVALALLWLLPDSQGRRRHQWVSPASQPPALTDLAVQLPAPSLTPLKTLTATLERPLFVEARRPLPVASASAPPPAPPDELEKSKLLGVINGPTFTGLLAQIDGKTRIVQRGQTIGSWTLQSIRDREAVFTQGGREHTLRLEYAHGGAGASPKKGAPSVSSSAPAAPAR